MTGWYFLDDFVIDWACKVPILDMIKDHLAVRHMHFLPHAAIRVPTGTPFEDVGVPPLSGQHPIFPRDLSPRRHPKTCALAPILSAPFGTFDGMARIGR